MCIRDSSRTDQIALAPLVEEILTDLTSLAQKNNISLQQDCAEPVSYTHLDVYKRQA